MFERRGLTDLFETRRAGRASVGRRSLRKEKDRHAAARCSTTTCMSWVANVMMSVDVADSASVEMLSEWLRKDAPRRAQPQAHGVGFLKLLTTPGTNEWGGWKHPECEVWAGALNHADLDALKQRVFETAWREPNLVQLLVMDQQEGFFRMWMIRDNELRQFAPLQPNEEDEGFYRG